MLRDNLRELRIANNLSEDQVAKFLGITSTEYANYELGTCNMPLSQMEEVAYLLGCSLSVLLSDNPDVNKSSLPLVFSAGNLTTSDLKEIAHFKKVALNYMKISRLQKNESKEYSDS